MFTMVNIKKYINRFVGYVLRIIPVDDTLIVFESEGDLSDNSYALYDYLKNNNLLPKYKVVWLIESKDNEISDDNCRYILKTAKKDYLRRTMYLCTCKYYIYDHCNYIAPLVKRNKQLVVNLWHGCGFKAENYATSKSNIDLMISTSPFFNDVLSKIHGVDVDKIKPLGYPRTDYFFRPLNTAQLKLKDDFKKYKKVILWMPTFRRSNNINLDESYFSSYTGLPVVTSEQMLLDFDSYLTEHGMLCIFKVHHLQADLPVFRNDFKNILIISDNDVKKIGLQLYQYIMLTDALITDYSSISTDYMLLNKPIIYTVDDYEQYNQSRGFAFDNVKQYFAGEQVLNIQELYGALDNLLLGNDLYVNFRDKINKILNSYSDGESSYRILKAIGIE